MIGEHARLLKYEFEDFEVDVTNRILSRDHELIPLQARAFDCLIYLIGHAGQLVTKSDMMKVIWANSFVEESSLTVAISTIRRALGERHQDRRYIQTVPGHGYRFVCAVRESITEPSLHSAEILADVARPHFVAESPSILPVHSEFEVQGLSQVPQVAPPVSVSPSRSLRWKGYLSVAMLLIFLVAVSIWGYQYLHHSKISSLAILPFNNVTKDQDDSVLLGMADSLVTDLENELPVRQMSSVLQYSSSSADPAAIGREQGVDAVVTGNLSRNGDTATMRVTMLRSSDGHVLWERYLSAKNSDTQKMQIVIEAALRQEIKKISKRHLPTQPPGAPRPVNAEAYQLYLRARYFWSRRTDKSLRQSIEYYKESIVIDPKFALAYAGLAESYALQADLSIVPGKTCGPDARAAALGAIALDPQLAEPHAALGMVSFFADWNGFEAEKEFQKAIALDPDDATAHHWYALDLGAMGRLPEALYEIRRAHALEPLSLIIGTNVGWILYLNRDYDQAIKEYEKVLELDPNFARARTRLGIAQMQSGDLPGAITNLEAAATISGGDPYVIGLLAEAEAMAGHPKGAETLLRNLDSNPEIRYVPPISRALVYIGLHEDSRALDELQRGFQDHSTALTYAKVDPSLDRLRRDVRFQKLLSTMQF
jgi:DNA-binding winged helix-turn-helix (wHTH) protein/Flp pilus assembly protein TadD/TolB-like protein